MSQSSSVGFTPALKKSENVDEEVLADPVQLRENVLQHYYDSVESLKGGFRERLQELFFIQSGGNMVDYPAWKMRSNTHLLTFLNAFRLDDNISFSTPTATNTISPSVKMQAVYTTAESSAIDVQNNKAVKSEIVPNQSIKSEIKLERNLSVQRPSTPQNHTIETHEDIAGQVRKESEILDRVAYLRKNGLWSTSRLPKVYEQPRKKSHWDFMQEEMQWLAADFAQEKKWKRNMAKKLSRAVLKYHQECASQTKKAEREETIRLKRIASGISKEIKQFWQAIEKVACFKQQSRQEEQRKKALDLHLNFIVDQTEKYSSWLVEGMKEPSSLNSPASSSIAADAEDEFELGNESTEDDETTIAQEEEDVNDEETDDELEALRRESEMPIEDLIETIPENIRHEIAGQSSSKSDMSGPSKIGSDDGISGSDSSEYEASDVEEDDEQTIDVEEKQDDDQNYEDELAQLQKENEIPIEELLKNYGKTTDEAEEIKESSESEYEEDDDEEEIKKDLPLSTLVNQENSNTTEEATDTTVPNKELNDAAATAESLQPKGFTLSTVQVKTSVPFLLKHTLREYQHIGLDWLVTMYAKQLNGILADEMGLGKTIQTIALLAHLACEEGCWGPHLIVVPTSVMLNWELEFKKWCPAFKILTYFGTQKERKLKRTGWCKPNAFHICITSYKLVIQDHQAFKRRKWRYLILDEAQNIKNFKSQRWQILLNFNSQRRLLLTGTPLQNSLMELWSLMHFLMPNIFTSHQDFKEWFANPLTGMIEGSREYSEGIIKRLHTVLRPFLLRRLKTEVELQMPKKYEHVIKCRLSKRQRFLYDEFMGRTKTKETIAAGNFLSVINILMQLRKVCNHPDLFELRPTVSPFVMDQVVYHTASLVDSALTRDPLETVDLPSWNFCLADLETSTAALQSYRVQQLKQKLIEDVTSSENAKTEPHVTGSSSFKTFASAKRSNSNGERSYMDIMTIAQTTYGCASIGDILTRQVEESLEASNVDVVNDDDKDVTTGNELEPPLPKKRKIQIHTSKLLTDYLPKEEDSPYFSSTLKIKADSEESHRLENLSLFNDRHCAASPMYGTDLRTKLTVVKSNTFFYNAQSVQCGCDTLQTFVKTPKQRLVELKSITDRFALFINPVLAPKIEMRMFHPQPSKVQHELNLQQNITRLCKQPLDMLYPLRLMSLIQFPETRLVQYDCGKLQALNELLRQLKIGKHRVLIFTQMTKMLDVLERFLNYHGYIYLRLDGNTKVEQRQMLMERFNQDDKIFIFILSTRSGGIGVNLTGADTVVFYDSDWNPTMDAQAQDRCHRIGQTRDVHIYRLISDRTVEENILKKAHQKRLLGNIAIEGGNFTTAFFKQDTVKELFNEEPIDLLTVEPTKQSSTATKADGSEPADAQYEKVLCTAEEEEDAKAAEKVKKEVELELVEFNDNNTTTAEEQKQDSKVEAELRELESQLRPIELCALKFMEATEMFTVDDEVEETERRIKQAKKDWELDHMRSMKEAEEQRYANEEDDMFFTYERDSTYGQDFVDDYTGITMPVWMPPTPPQDSETEEYVTDPCVSFLYENDTIPDNHLPPTHYIKKNGIDIYSMKRNTARTHYLSHFKNKRARVSKAKSIFDKKALELLTNKSKLKKSQKLKLKAMTLPNAPSTSVVKPDFPQHGPDWLINEDWALLQTVNVLSELPVDVVNESLHSRSVNWDLAADVVNAFSRSYRSSRQCKDRYQNIIIAREDGKLMVTTDTNDVKTKKKQKLSNPTTTTTVAQQQQTVQQASVASCVSVTKPLQQQPQAKTSIQFSADHGKSVLSMHFSKFESVKKAAAKRKPPLKQQNAKGQGGRSTQILVTNGTPSLEKPLNPKDLATMRAERIAKEKAQAVLAAQQTTTATCTTTTTTTSTPPATRTTTASAAATQQQQHQIYFKGNQIVKGAAANNTNAANIRGNLVFTTTSSVAGTLVVNPAAVSSVTTATSFRKQNTVAVTSPVTGNLTHASMSNTARILTASQNMTIGGKTATSSSIIAPNLVAQVQRGTTGISTGSTAAGLITTHPFIQGKPLTPQQINILRQKAVQQQQQQQMLKLQQQQQRLQQQKQQQQQFKIMQQQQMQTTKHGAQPTIVVSSTQLANLTVQTIKAPLRGSVPQQIVTQSLTAAQQQQLLQQALKNKQLQQLQQRGQLQASNSQIQQMLAGQKLTHQQLQQLQQQQQRHSLQQQLKFQPQQVSAAMVSSQHKPQLVMAQVKQGINSQSLKSSAQQIQLHQLQQGASVQGGSLPQQILLRPTLTQTSGQYQGVPQQIHLRALINQSNQQRAGNQQAMQAQVNIQTGTVVMQQQTSQASTLAQQQQRNIQAAVQKQVLQQQKSQAKSPQTISSPQSQRQQVLSATPAQLSQVKAFVSQATQQQQHQPGTHSPSTVTSSPPIQLQAQQVGQQMRRQAQLVQVKLADDNKKKVASQTTQSETVVMDHQLTDGVTTLGAETELSTGETSAEDHGTRTARTHK